MVRAHHYRSSNYEHCQSQINIHEEFSYVPQRSIASLHIHQFEHRGEITGEGTFLLMTSSVRNTSNCACSILSSRRTLFLTISPVLPGRPITYKFIRMSWMDSWSRPSKHAVTPPPLYLTVGEEVPYCRSCGRIIGQYSSFPIHARLKYLYTNQ